MRTFGLVIDLPQTTFRILAECHAIIERCRRASVEAAKLLERTRDNVESSREFLRRIPSLATSPETANGAWKRMEAPNPVSEGIASESSAPSTMKLPSTGR